MASESLLAGLTKFKMAERQLGAEDVSFQCPQCSGRVPATVLSLFISSLPASQQQGTWLSVVCSPNSLSKTGKRAAVSYHPSQLDQGNTTRIYQDNLSYSEFIFKT